MYMSITVLTLRQKERAQLSLYSVEWNGGMVWNSGMVECWNSGMTTPTERAYLTTITHSFVEQ